MKFYCFASTVCALLSIVVSRPLAGADWPQFRGPDGLGVSTDANVAVQWSESENLQWKTPLPGAGSSSPIVRGQHVFVTCYSGYGLDRTNPGNIEQLVRHLVCIDRKDGTVIWTRTVKAEMPEDAFVGMGVPEHGYASNTPATDSERVFVFFGKSGVLAFDFDGNQLWQVNVGKESSNRRWGSSASLILHKDTVIVNASEESRSILALDKGTGKEIWRAEASSLELSYGTPLLAQLDGGKELVIGVPYEVWGLNPDTGKLNWYAETGLDGNVAPSPVAADGVAFVFGGYRNTGSVAIRAGGKGDVTDTHTLWSSRDASYVPSPVIHKGMLYWVSDQGIAFCADARTGETIYRERLSRTGSSSRGGKPIYASVVLAGDKLICVSRRGGTYVLAAKPEFEQLAHNEFESDESDFNASPAISNGQLFLRSNRYLYCTARVQGR